MLKITPRDYQKNIFETAKKSNTLVVLPTGVGKTLIALMLSIDRLKAHPLSKILFLAPTRPLVEQHFETFKKELPELFAQLDLFTGSVKAQERKKIWQRAEIVFSTPQCIANDLRHSLYNLSEVSLLIIDEAHRCLKNYDYTSVVKSYKSQAKNQLIFGLTASPGSDKEKVNEICAHLNIQSLEVRTRDSADVKPYLQELEFEKISVPFPKEFIEIQVLLKRIWDEKIEQLRKRNLLFGPANKITVLKLQANLARRAFSKDFQAMIGMSLTAQAIKISHAIELLETQTLSGLNEYLKNLIKQAEQKQSKAVQTLVKTPEFNAALISLNNLLTKKIEHPKISETIKIVESQFQSKKDSKIIIFTQYRETASSIVDKLKSLSRVYPSVFVGQTKKSSSSGISSGLNQKSQKEIINKFRSGEINVLVATSIGEEGLDIPEVSLVLFYEPIPSAIRKIQRAGRTARLSPGKLFILVTENTRDEIHHYASAARERKMYKTLDLVKEEMKNKDNNPTLDKFRAK